jgi:hypothetical protein
MSGPGGAPVSEAFVEALGLKPLFTAFMGKVSILRLTFNNLPPTLLTIKANQTSKSEC